MCCALSFELFTAHFFKKYIFLRTSVRLLSPQKQVSLIAGARARVVCLCALLPDVSGGAITDRPAEDLARAVRRVARRRSRRACHRGTCFINLRGKNNPPPQSLAIMIIIPGGVAPSERAGERRRGNQPEWGNPFHGIALTGMFVSLGSPPCRRATVLSSALMACNA